MELKSGCCSLWQLNCVDMLFNIHMTQNDDFKSGLRVGVRVMFQRVGSGCGTNWADARVAVRVRVCTSPGRGGADLENWTRAGLCFWVLPPLTARVSCAERFEL